MHRHQVQPLLTTSHHPSAITPGRPIGSYRSRLPLCAPPSTALPASFISFSFWPFRVSPTTRVIASYPLYLALHRLSAHFIHPPPHTLFLHPFVAQFERVFGLRATVAMYPLCLFLLTTSLGSSVTTVLQRHWGVPRYLLRSLSCSFLVHPRLFFFPLTQHVYGLIFLWCLFSSSQSIATI